MLRFLRLMSYGNPQPFKRQSHKTVKPTQTICWQQTKTILWGFARPDIIDFSKFVQTTIFFFWTVHILQKNKQTKRGNLAKSKNDRYIDRKLCIILQERRIYNKCLKAIASICIRGTIRSSVVIVDILYVSYIRASGQHTLYTFQEQVIKKI